MAYDGTLKFDTSMDAKGFQKGADSLGNIVKGMGVFKLLEKGFQAIVGSIDAAVSRYDTLNRFPKIMEQMGYGAQEGEAAIQKLSDGIIGLPTTLDDIVTSTRQLTVATGSLNTGVDSALALNNAFYASGATAADASRGFIQYNQMLSSGKVDMISWRTLNETMTYALQKTAEAFGYTGASAKQDLYAALQSGGITFQQFNAKLIELNNGVGGFAEIAKTATGGIGTAWINLKTAIVRGTTGIIQSIDTGLSKTRFKGIENIINKMKDGITKALSVVAKAFGVLAENIENIILVLGIATVAVIAYKAAISIRSLLAKVGRAQMDMVLATAASSAATIADTAATTGQTIALTAQTTVLKIASAGRLKEARAILASAVANGQLTFAQAAQVTMTALQSGKIGLATAAQWLWNAAMEANPIGMFIMLIAALVAGLILLTKALQSDAYKEHKANVDAINDSYDALETKAEESSVAHSKAAAALQAQSAEGKELVGTLGELAAVTERTSAHETALGTTIDSLNQQYEGLNLTVEEYNSNPSAAMERAEEFMRLSDAVGQADLAIERQNQLMEEERAANEGLAQIAYEREQIAASLQNGNIYAGEAVQLMTDLWWAERDCNATLEDNATLQDAATEAALDAAAVQERAMLNREKALNGAVDAEGRNIRALAEAWGLTTDEILADMEKQGKDFAAWSADNAKYYTSDGENIEQIARQWGVTVTEVEAYLNEMGADLDGYVEHQKSLVTESGMNLDMVAEKWGMTTDEVTALMNEWGFTLDDVNERMKEIHTEAGESVADLAAQYGVSIEEINKWMTMNDETAQGWKDHQIELFDEWRDVAAGGIDSVVNGFKEIPVQADISLQELTDIMVKNNERNMAWKQNLVSASQALGPEMMQVISSWGPEYNSLLEEYLADPNGELGQKFYSQMKTAAEMEVGAYTDTLPQFQAAGDEAGSVLGSGVGTGMRESAEPTAASQEIADGVVTNLTSADFSALTTAIANAVKSGTGSIVSAVTSMSTSVQGVFRTMSAQAQGIAAQAMTGINSVIITRTAMAKSAATAVANGIVAGLEAVVSGGAGVATRLMDGILAAMNNKAGSLYAKAREIANTIRDTMAAALDVHSPSRVMVRLFENVMLGVYEGMHGMSGMLYREAGSIADGLAERLAVSPDVFGSMYNRLRAVTSMNPPGGSALVPQAAYATAAGGTTYAPTFHQTINSPKHTSPSENSREMRDFVSRSRFQVP